MNDIHVIAGSSTLLPIQGLQVQVLEAQSVDLLNQAISEAHDWLYMLAKLLCTKASETDLPPLHAINHMIPLININKIYPWCLSWCPEVMCLQWVEKHCSYLKTRHWRVTSKGNTMPMLLIKKPGTDKLQTVVDLHERNTSPQHPYWISMTSCNVCARGSSIQLLMGGMPMSRSTLCPSTSGGQQ